MSGRRANPDLAAVDLAEVGTEPEVDDSHLPEARPSTRRAAFRSLVDGISLGMLVLVIGLAALTVGIPALIGGAPLTILSGSMSPALQPGSLIVVKPTPVDEIAVGDVITFQLDSGRPTLVTHRVIARITDTASGEIRFVTQGDANNAPDANPVSPVQIRGTVWYMIPGLGWANQVINGEMRTWLVPLIAGVLFAYAGWMLVSGLGERRRRPRSEHPVQD